MRKVVVFRSVLLPRSEVFVQEQVQFLTNWKPLLVGYRWIKDGLDLQGLGATTIPGSSPKTVGRYALRLCQLLERPHPPTVATLRDTGAKLVHAHFGTDATDIWPSVRAAGLPMVVTLHGYDINIRREWWEAGKGGVLRRFYPRRLLTMAHEPAVYFIAVSHAIRCRAIEYGIPEDKITVSYIGVDTERFKPGGLPIDQRRKRILFVGRMVEKKAPLLLIRGYAEVRKQVPEAQLVMIGDGPLLKDAKRLARTLDVPVEFHGAQDSYAVQAQLHLARVLCLPSVTAENGDAEGFGLVILEAQASGVPVVTSAQGGAFEGVLDGHTGHAFNEYDMDAMVQGLLVYMRTDDRLVASSAAAAQHAQTTFDLRVCSRQLERIYDASYQPTFENEKTHCIRP